MSAFLGLLTAAVLDAGFAVYFFLTPLLMAVATCRSVRQLTSLAIMATFGSSIICFQWVWNYDHNYFGLVVAALCTFFIVFLGSSYLLHSKLGSRWNLIILPSTWLALMWIFSLFPAGNFWLDIAIFQPLAAPLIGVIGSAGITYLIVLNNLVWAEALRTNNRQLLILGFTVFMLLASAWGYSQIDEGTKKTHKIALLQGNFAMDWQWRQLSAPGIIFKRYRALSERAAQGEPDLIVWPEYALPVDLLNRNPIFRKRVEQLSSELGIPMLIGSIVITDDGRSHFDSALMFDSGAITEVYHSRFPAFFNQFTVADDSRLKLLSATQMTYGFGTVICYEETLSGLFLQYARLGAQVFISLANNQDLGLGRKLASRYGQLRAGENETFLVRASNDGSTQVVNARGRVKQRIPEQEQGLLMADIALAKGVTIYNRFGYLPLVLLILLINSLFYRLSIKGSD